MRFKFFSPALIIIVSNFKLNRDDGKSSFCNLKKYLATLILAEWVLTRVVSAPNVNSFDQFCWSTSGLSFTATSGNELWFWDLSVSGVQRVQLDDVESEGNDEIQQELQFFRNSQKNLSMKFDTKINAIAIHGDSVFVSLENGTLQGMDRNLF